jgi:hypothetical protein
MGTYPTYRYHRLRGVLRHGVCPHSHLNSIHKTDQSNVQRLSLQTFRTGAHHDPLLHTAYCMSTHTLALGGVEIVMCLGALAVIGTAAAATWIIDE